MEITKTLIESLALRDKKSFSEIAKITGKNVGFISNKAKEFGIISLHMDKIAKKPLPIFEIYAMYIGGQSLDLIRKKYNAPIARIKKQLKKFKPDIIFRSRDEAVRPCELNDPQKLIAYAESNMTCRKISKHLGVKEATVVNAYRRMNIGRFTHSPVIIAKDELNRLYWDSKKSSVEIAKMFGISPGQVITMLSNNGIPIRGFGGCRVSKHKEFQEREWLFEEYITQQRSMADIATEIGTSVGNVSHFLKKYSIEVRTKEEVCDKLTGSGVKTYVDVHGNKIDCDSLLEIAFLESHDKPENVIKRPQPMKYLDILYYPDFDLNGQIIEVKSKSESSKSGVNRRRLIKQLLVAKKNGIDVKVWNGKFIDICLDEFDKYCCKDWRLVFDSSEDCFKWLVSFGFRGVHSDRFSLVDGLKKFAEIVNSSQDLLNANIPSSDIIRLIWNFSDHYFHSKHQGYNAIAEAWDVGNRMVLKSSLEDMWARRTEVSLYGLIKHIGKYKKDFAPVSVFKPWVASYVYDKFLPNGGIVVDPCMGWGGRLIGCLHKNLKYFGSDLNPNSVHANEELRKILYNNVGETKFDIRDASTEELPNGDLLFTSPPYDNTELYSGINSQITKTDDIVGNIFTRFLGKFVILNVPLRKEKDSVAIGKKYGWLVKERLQMTTASFMGREKTYEPILMFSK